MRELPEICGASDGLAIQLSGQIVMTAAPFGVGGNGAAHRTGMSASYEARGFAGGGEDGSLVVAEYS